VFEEGHADHALLFVVLLIFLLGRRGSWRRRRGWDRLDSGLSTAELRASRRFVAG